MIKITRHDMRPPTLPFPSFPFRSLPFTNPYPHSLILHFTSVFSPSPTRPFPHPLSLIPIFSHLLDPPLSFPYLPYPTLPSPTDLCAEEGPPCWVLAGLKWPPAEAQLPDSDSPFSWMWNPCTLPDVAVSIPLRLMSK